MMVNWGLMFPESPQTIFYVRARFEVCQTMLLTDDAVVGVGVNQGDRHLNLAVANIEAISQNDCST